MVKLVVILGLLFGSASAAPTGGEAVWSALSEDVAQFGIPDTDIAGLVVFCDRAEGLSIGGPLSREAAIGARISLTFSAPGLQARRTVVVSECDGLCFTTPMKADDRVLKALLDGRSLKIDQAGEGWTVPGKGAAPVLLPLIKACGVARRK
jgi:hypothetical protein